MVHFGSLVLVFLMGATAVADARNGYWHGRNRSGEKGIDSGEYNFFLQPENRPQTWYCGPGLLPSQPCARRTR